MLGYSNELLYPSPYGTYSVGIVVGVVSLKSHTLINVLVHSVENNLLNEWLKYEKMMLCFCVRSKCCEGICEGCCA